MPAARPPRWGRRVLWWQGKNSVEIMADVSRNGALRDAQPSRILERTARTKVDRYRAGYAALKYAFLPCVISTSGRLHGEFLRLLYIIAHRRTVNWFSRHSNDEPSEKAFKFRRGQYFWYTRAMIGQAAARAPRPPPCVAPGYAELLAGRSLRPARRRSHQRHGPPLSALDRH